MSVGNYWDVVAILITEKIVPFHYIFVNFRMKFVFFESIKGTRFVLFLDRWRLIDQWLGWVLNLEFNGKFSSTEDSAWSSTGSSAWSSTEGLTGDSNGGTFGMGTVFCVDGE